jgi:Holliday junction resolvase RusA-like endonuclease
MFHRVHSATRKGFGSQRSIYIIGCSSKASDSSVARQRDPIDVDLPFAYWVFGRPISYRNNENKKPEALDRWKKSIEQSITSIISDLTNDRGYKLYNDLTEIRILWMSTDVRDRTQPDIDNILKPLIDALVNRVISDDRETHRLIAEKADINDPPAFAKPYMDEIQEDPAFRALAEVTIVQVDQFKNGSCL